MFPDGGEHGVEFVEVEAGSDLDVGDHPLGDPVVDGPGADRQALGEFLLLDEGWFRSVQGYAGLAMSTHGEFS